MAFQFNKDEEKRYLKMLSNCIKANILPNCFARYALIKNIEDPYSLPLDNITKDDIDEATSKLKSFWNNNSNNPKYTTDIYRLLNENNKVKSILLDSEELKNERKKIESQYKEHLEKKYKQLDGLLEISAVEGYITNKQLNNIYNKLSKDFSNDDIDRRILDKKIQLRESDEKKRENFQILYPTLDDSILTPLRSYLNVFKKNNVYEFLGVSENESIDQIRKKYFEIEEYWGPTIINNEKTAAQRILGFIKSNIFEGEPQKYKNSLQYEAISKLNPLIEIIFENGFLEEHKFAEIISKAKSESINEDFATAYILDKAEKQNIPVLKQRDANIIKCPECYFLNNKSNDHCENCGQPLYIVCIKCKRKEPALIKACTGCGFVFNNIAKVNYLLERYNILHRQGKIKEALSSVIDAKKLLGGDNNELEKKISELQEELKKLDAIYHSYELSLSDKELYKAREEIRKLRDISPGYDVNGKTLDEMISTLNTEIKRVEIELQSARGLEQKGKNDEAVIAYENILNFCKDCGEARNELRRIPPDLPQDIAISYQRGVASLNWKKSPSIGDIKYHIIRKEGSKPTSVNDGKLIIETKYLAAEDKTGEVGHNYFYCIFAERNGAFSLNGATTDCVLFYADVIHFALSPGDGVIEGTWELPGSVKRISVYKKEGGVPSKEGDGEEIPVLGLTKFIDKKVQNGQKYFYKIFCEFIDHKNSIIITKGVEASSVPNSPPSALKDFTIEREEAKIVIKWIPLKKGSVFIIKSSKAPAYKEGELISKSEISKLGTLLSSSGNNYTTDNVPQHGIYFYTAITIENDSAVIGKTQKLNFVEDVSNVRGNYLGSHIQLKWKWPDGCKETLVSWGTDMYPNSASDVKAKQKRIQYHEYEKNGGFILEKPERKKYLFKIFAVYKDGNEDIFSPGIGPETGTEIMVQEGKIKYKIKKSYFSSKYQIFIQSDKFIKESPELVLIANRGKIRPLNKQSGVELIRIKNTSIGLDEKCIAELEKSKLPKPCYLRVFFADESSYNNYIIEDPTPKELIIQ
jgi:hypothetical protein